MTTERDLRLSIEMVRARKASLSALAGGLVHVPLINLVSAFDAGYKAALEDHADCHPAGDVDMCQEAVKAASRE